MKRFLIKFLIFFGLFHATTAFYQFYVVKNISGDIGALAKIPFGSEYDGLTVHSYHRPAIPHACVVDVCLPESLCCYSVITIGDSFSQKEECGYQWKLSSLLQETIANFPLGKSNPFECAAKMINGGFVDSSQILIIQSVERNLVYRLTTMDTMAVWNPQSPGQSNDVKTPFLDEYLSWIRLSLGYDNPIFSFSLNRECFENPRFASKLYVYNGEYEGDFKFQLMTEDNYIYAANRLRQFLAFARSRGVTTYVLIATDKYDAYEPFIDGEHTVNPTLNYFQDIEGVYETKRDIQNAIERGMLDVYKHNDTHWSVVGADLVAEKLAAFVSWHDEFR